MDLCGILDPIEIQAFFFKVPIQLFESIGVTLTFSFEAIMHFSHIQPHFPLLLFFLF